MSKMIKTADNAATAVSSLWVSDPSYVERDTSLRWRVRQWFINPLKAMSGSQGFLVLMVLFPLYEKHLKLNEGMGENEKFSEGAPIFNVIGRHLKIGAHDAYLFWTHFRNGLLHKALPQTESFKYALRETGPPIEVKGEWFWVNPYGVRDRLLPIIESGLQSWKHDNVGLPLVFDQMSQ